MSEKIPNFLKNGYLALALGTIIVLSFFLVAEPVSLDRKYNNQSIKIAEDALKHVNKFYLDKAKIDYAEMLEKAVSSLETFLDDVLVEFPEDRGGNFAVQVKEKTKKFKEKELPSSNDVASTLGQVVSFVLSNTGAEERAVKNIEYSISDSMLKVLDPHSAMIPPDVYKEFLIDTEGSFGGLGIVVGIRDGQLTVISPIEGTPAYRSGIKTKDKIVQIENESTINMPLLEAVGKLRGKKGTKVNLLISRKNFSKPKKFSIIRDTIKIESVEGFDLENDILYLRIRNFQKNTSSDLKKEIKSRSYPIKGVILDLRANPGGLLSEAEKVADLFLSSGTIMTTRARDYSKTYRATARQPEYKGKVIVLVNQGSASASEIVAGALKNNKRAVVVGKRSFGKGSVQKIFEFEDGAALKLTIAKYLTPGNISIQDSGITPDILLQGSFVNEEKVVYNPLPEKRENAEETEPPTPELTIKYIDDSLAPQEEDEAEVQPDESLTKAQKLEKLESDFYIKLSSRLLLAETPEQMYAAAGDFSNAQLEEIRTRIEDTGIDWSAGKTKDLSVSVETVPSKTVFRAGEESFLEIKVTNSSPDPIYRLSAVTDCENRVYSNGELLFGKLLPGQSKTSKVKFSVPRWVTTREDNLKLVFTSSGEKTFTEENLLVRTVADKRPVYSHNHEIVDDGRFESKGNGNGRAEFEETVVLNLRLKNVGDGISEKTVVTLKNLSGDGVFLERGRIEFENFRPGEIRFAPFRFRQNGKADETKFELIVMDEDFREVKTQKITLPVFAQERPFSPASAKKTAVFRDTSYILGGTFPEASSIALAQKSSTVKVLGASGRWIRVEGKNSVAGWVEEKSIRVNRASHDDLSGETPGESGSNGAAQEISLLEEAFEWPPSIIISDFPMSTEDSMILVRGSVRDSDRIESVSVWKKNDKIKLLTPGKNTAPLLFPLTLEEGINLFTIVAKDEKGMTSRKILAIRKDIS
ncbi:MAG: PDZ domain-containing protein [Candidatus Dadabacteria bacterium]|nr:PDZ domain-containing protein [Candidatus Dadabacteria bacterium]MYA47994.1 PDZ domain-containing protein [Candidatus Dadabacteria bacterium]MYK49136.1 PDZ domain-containing protein [Candidatus Dadabacteria bacterium]